MAFTYFFRDRQTLELIRDRALPELAGRREIRVWDAGCAMGQEPFSLAIILREAMNPFAFRRLQICATDVDPSGEFEATLQCGVYADADVERIPTDLRRKYFSEAQEPGFVELSDEIRTRISFQRHDLLTFTPPFDKNMDVILCKNVLLHFNEAERSQVVRMFCDSLSSPGFLVMEQTQELPAALSPAFERVVSHAQVFRKVGPVNREPTPCPLRTAESGARPASLVP